MVPPIPSEHPRRPVPDGRSIPFGVLTKALPTYGWEIDAAVVGREEYVPTFLLSGIDELEILDETFERPPDVDERIERNRREVAVTFVVPQGARWVVERHAESAEVLEEDEESVKLRANVLPPIQRRVGLVLLIAGTDAFVTEPADLRDAGRDLARELLKHHRAP
jgi:predicted DNA-binding transcriptional regulator YafY